MEIKVLRDFTSNETGHTYRKNDVWPLEADKEKELIEGRKEALIKLDLIEEAEAPKDMTKDEIKAELDAKGIEYDPKATKPELVSLLEGKKEAE